ncbi:NAD(P)H-dependent flavin oxidoreductase [Pseudalkalibacillus sp. Hm43]|uniref:NAD(P)H-dependent flavin oxidoreductase n=1 Tax=Pseudalkalibacillus sp. Hm43 TaxID=3450742 RepID=UPI003F43D885
MKTVICGMLNIQYPIIQAGMAGGITTAELVASVSEAGGLGTIGAGYLTPEDTRQAIIEVRKHTNRPFAVNLFNVHKVREDPRTDEVIKHLSPIYENLEIKPNQDVFEVKDYYEEQFEVLLEEDVPVISTTFGVPDSEQIERAHEKGIKVVTMVTTVEEARLAEKAGVDVLIAQGSEAGGHRGTFEYEEQFVTVGTFALVPQIVDHVSIPVIAAGGIMDGRGMVAAIALGAKGIQLGTRFLNAYESGAPDLYKKALLESNEESTVLTSAFSGRPARALRNTFVDLFQSKSIEPLHYPIQNMLTKEIRSQAKRQGKLDYMSLWSGQGNRLIKPEQSASEIVEEIVRETELSLKSLREHE